MSLRDCLRLQKVFEIGRGVKVDEQTIETLMMEVDDNNDGAISFAEFVQVMVRHKRQRDAYEELVESFKVFLESVDMAEDADPASRITEEMICNIFKKVGMIDEDAAVDSPIVETLMEAARKDDQGNWRPGLSPMSEPTIPYAAFKHMMFDFGNPMASSVGINLRKVTKLELPGDMAPSPILSNAGGRPRG